MTRSPTDYNYFRPKAKWFVRYSTSYREATDGETYRRLIGAILRYPPLEASTNWMGYTTLYDAIKVAEIVSGSVYPPYDGPMVTKYCWKVRFFSGMEYKVGKHLYVRYDYLQRIVEWNLPWPRNVIGDESEVVIPDS